MIAIIRDDDLNISSSIDDIEKESFFEWKFVDLLRKYIHIMRENVAIIYPIKPKYPI